MEVSQQLEQDVFPFPLLKTNCNNQIVFYNELARELLKLPVNEIINMNIYDVFHFDNLTHDNQQPLQCSFENQARLISTNNQSNTFNISINYSPNDDSHWLFIQPQQQKVLKTQAILARLNHAIDAADIGVWEYKIQSKTPFFTAKFKELINKNPTKELSWDDFKKQIFHSDRSIFDIFFKQHIKYGIPLNFEFRLQTEEGLRWLHIKGELHRDNDSPYSVMGTLTDCTQAKNTLTEMNKAIESKNIAMEVGKIGTWHAELTDQDSWQWEWNSLTNDILGLKPEDIGNIEKWQSTYHPDDRAKIITAMAQSLSSGENFSKQYRIIMPDGETKYLLSQGKVGKDFLGNNCRIDGVIIDQSEIYIAQKQLKELNSQLEDHVEQRTKELLKLKENAENANQIKSDFLSMMSHELRTPMNAIIGSLDLLATTKQTPDSVDLIDTAKTSAENLVYILNDILDINKIEAEKLVLEDQVFSIAEVIDNVIKVFIPVANKNKIHLDLFEDPKIPMFIIGDQIRVRQILFNLIGNALKFTKTTTEQEGCVSVDASVIEINDYVCTISIKIIDNGIGIDEKTQHKLFKPFIQAERSTTRKYGGTGLGLAICGKLTEMMGGQITLTSEKGKGSCFDVELPLWRSQETRALDVESLSAVNISLAYFNSQYQQKIDNYVQYLKDEGANVYSCNLFENDFAPNQSDLIFVFVDDLNANQEYAEEFITPLLNEHHICVAVRHEHVEAARALFPGAHITHSLPITRIQLIETIKKNWIGHFELEIDELDLSDLELPLELEPIAPELKGGILVVEDNPLNQKLIVKQLKNLGYACDIADDGQDGKDKWQAGDYKLILTDCHMPNIDGYDMTRLIRELEIKEKRSRIPIIAVTGAAMSGDDQHCLAAGMDEFVSKPIQLTHLKDVLQKWYKND